MKSRVSSISDLPLVLTVEEIAGVLGVGRCTAYAFVRSGAIKSIRVGNQIRIPRAEVMKLLEL